MEGEFVAQKVDFHKCEDLIKCEALWSEGILHRCTSTWFPETKILTRHYLASQECLSAFQPQQTSPRRLVELLTKREEDIGNRNLCWAAWCGARYRECWQLGKSLEDTNEA